VQNISFENGFYLHENESVGRTLLHLNDFARRLVLTQAKSNSVIAYWRGDGPKREKKPTSDKLFPYTTDPN